jgi:hypothetical protein
MPCTFRIQFSKIVDHSIVSVCQNKGLIVDHCDELQWIYFKSGQLIECQVDHRDSNGQLQQEPFFPCYGSLISKFPQSYILFMRNNNVTIVYLLWQIVFVEHTICQKIIPKQSEYQLP